MNHIGQKEIAQKKRTKFLYIIKLYCQLLNLSPKHNEKIKYYSLWGKFNNVVKIYNYYLTDLKKYLTNDYRFKDFPFRKQTLYAQFLVYFIETKLIEFEKRKKFADMIVCDLSDYEIELRLIFFSLKNFLKNLNDPYFPVEFYDEFNYKNMCRNSSIFIEKERIFSLKEDLGGFVFKHVHILKEDIESGKINYIFTPKDLENIKNIEKNVDLFMRE